MADDRAMTWQRLRALPLPGFVLVYTGLYGVLIVIGSTVGYLVLANQPSFGAFVLEMMVAAVYLVLASVVPFAIALAVVFLFRDARPVWFRLAAVLLCCLPSMCTSEPRQLAYFLPMQILVALVIRQPYDPARDRVGDQH
ncbi:hypothetical protein C7C45_16130 [Micromonospora arborensis]|uniref:Uncharacterized protein n=1 Tax=Micromonospora arborensis TaxID=2116518 RepID=A0A318P180_9ACTN|nr:hypothetical protein [Micromonospora arborensis]PYC69222.1 hypothetical protein C7C45_16130 [Micromonospora arborensis]